MPPSAASNHQKNTVQSLAKGLKILEVFTAQDPELTLAEVARRAGYDNATAFRFLNTLVDSGYVRRVPDSRLFRLTSKTLDLGFNAIAHADLRSLARPVLRELVGASIEAASIGVLDGAEILYIERVHAGLAKLGLEVRIGNRMPAYSTAIGHAILAWLPEATQRAILDAFPRDQRTTTTLTDMDALLARLREVKARGYAVSNQENVYGLYIVAAPLLDLDGRPLASLSVVTPASQGPLASFVSEAAEPVKAAAAELSKFLQTMGSGPTPRVA